MNGEVREMPEYHVAYVRKMGPCGKETCQQAFGELTPWAAPRGYLGTGVSTMRSKMTVACLAVALALAGGAIAAAAEGQQAEPTFDHEAVHKLWAEFAKLTPKHEDFKHMVGQWDAKTVETHPGMDEPNTSQGKASFRLMMDGRFLQQRYEAEYEGNKFHGFGIYGYDKAKKKYFLIWLDNMSTGMMLSEGEYDDDADQLVLEGEAKTPTGDMQTRTVIKSVDDDTFTTTIYVTMPGFKNHKAMVTTYTRRK